VCGNESLCIQPSQLSFNHEEKNALSNGNTVAIVTDAAIPQSAVGSQPLAAPLRVMAHAGLLATC